LRPAVDAVGDKAGANKRGLEALDAEDPRAYGHGDSHHPVHGRNRNIGLLAGL